MTNFVAQQNEEYPIFLQDYAKLLSHFQLEFESLNSKQRGDRFAEFTRRIVAHTPIGERFERPQKTKDSYDEGVDFISVSKDGSDSLYIQAKYTIPGVDELDLILSKFESYKAKSNSNSQSDLFSYLDAQEVSKGHFMIVTSRDIHTQIMPRYERSKRLSVQFYNQLKEEGRIHIVDGPQILQILRETYRKSYQLPTELTLKAAVPFIHMDDVYVGIVSGSELKRLYGAFGNALFFENIREYQGPTSGKVKAGSGRTTVNEAIARTLETEPRKFLSRNNGITFRANTTRFTDETTLELGGASIVNGCQTTMSIVRSANDESYVLVKVVRASDSWDIAKAANFQNSVDQLVLELARYIRPQVIRVAADRFSVRFRGGSEDASAFAVVDSIYQEEITEDEFRTLFLGIFSSSPRNAISANYTELRTDIISQLFREDNPEREVTFEKLFRIHQITQQGAQKLQEWLEGDEGLSDLFQRFWKEDKPNYRALLSILAACGCANENIYSNSSKPTYQDMMRFLSKLETVIDRNPDVFLRYYQLAFTSVALDVIRDEQDRQRTLQHMKTTIERSSFDNLFFKLRTLANTDYWLKANAK